MVVLWTEKETKREVRYEWTKYFQFSQISSQSWIKCLKKNKKLWCQNYNQNVKGSKLVKKINTKVKN